MNVQQQQAVFFNSYVTRSYTFRKQQLTALKLAIQQNEPAILAALYADLGKSAEEAYASEVGFVLAEITTTLKHLQGWMKPKKVSTNLLNIPGSSKIIAEPLGVVFIIAPWNYPFQLAIAPLIGAIAAGNCATVKPSELAPATANVLQNLIQNTFQENYVSCIQGDGALVIPNLLQQFTFNHIFFTGSTAVGKIIYELAAKKLVPVTLELGGKSPAIIDADANINVAARKIVMGKLLNAGQTCVAPDYLLIHQSKHTEFIAAFSKAVADFYGNDILNNTEYPKIINEKRFNTLLGYLADAEILYGGNYNKEILRIQPTILGNVSLNAPVMQQEIFGPIMPLYTYETKEQAIAIVQQYKHPLALYIFTNNKAVEDYWLQNVSFGGGCVNNTLFHLSNDRLPFGGIGNSGIGAYHGKHSFNTFSHQKAILKTATWFDPNFKYPPFSGKMKLFKLFMR